MSRIGFTLTERGPIKGAHAAVGLPFAVRSGEGQARGGLAGADLSLFLDLSTERISLPGLAVRVDASLPAGGAAGSGAGLSVTGLATRSFGTHRVHLNASLALASPDTPGGGEHPSRWYLGMAVDHTLLRQSTLLVGEVSVASGARYAPLRYAIGVGMRRQFPGRSKGKPIETFLAEFRDGSKNVMSMAEWREMPEMMGGAARMGGVAWRPPIR